jgi:two-component system CheB/CheR fusion protein
LLEEILPQKTVFNDYRVEHDFEHMGRRTMLLNAREVRQADGKGRLILLAIEDVTEREA